LESDREVESRPLRQLEALVRSLGEELATFRRRAQLAEQRVRSLETSVAQSAVPVNAEQVRVLESENADLRARLAAAVDRTNRLLARVRFLRQQNGRTSGSHPAVGAGETQR
jgi:hypothetical protein